MLLLSPNSIPSNPGGDIPDIIIDRLLLLFSSADSRGRSKVPTLYTIRSAQQGPPAAGPRASAGRRDRKWSDIADAMRKTFGLVFDLICKKTSKTMRPRSGDERGMRRDETV